MATGKSDEAADRELVGTRLLNAPRELVWEVWTNPEHVAHWWGPHGFTSTIEEMDVRPGGTWRFVMHGPDGRSYANHIEYVEIRRPERLVYDHLSTPAFRATVTFTEKGDQTEITMRTVFASAEEREKVVKTFKADEGLVQHLSRLAAYAAAAAERGLTWTRTFDAPRELVWQAWTDPRHLAQWWGPHGFTNPRCEVDVRPGGAIHIDMRGPDGTTHPMIGAFRDVVPPERLAFAAWVPRPDGQPLFEVLNTVTFDVENGRTVQTLRAQVVKRTTAAGRFIVGMEAGWTQSLERLDAAVRAAARAAS